MGNRTVSLHAPKNQTIASRSLRPSIAPESMRRNGRCVCPPVVNLLMGVLILAISTMRLNAVVISPTTTMLAVSPSSHVSAGTMVTMTATVANPGIVSSGFVNFCDPTYSTCLPGDGLYGTAQLARSGTATLRMRFGTGNNSVVAVFVPTNTNHGSRSPTATIMVDPAEIYPSTTSLTASGGPGNYTLAGEVLAFGKQALSGTIGLLNLTANMSQIGRTSLYGAGFQFAPPTSIDTVTQPRGSAVADFNGDGFPDLVVTNVNSSSISVSLGKGDGSFGPAVKFQTGRVPESVGVGDFNGDGIADVAVANTVDNTVSILLGNGDGTFQAQSTLDSGVVPVSIVVGDFNADGIADLVVSNFQDVNVSVFLGNGDGTFQPGVTFPAGDTPQHLIESDLNGDGIADLVVVNTNSNTLSILLGNGDGTFQSRITTATGASPYFIAAGDFNRDGLVDLAVCNVVGDTISLLIGNGDGTFQTGNSVQAGRAPSSVAVGDFDGDGLLDLVITNQFDFNIEVFRGNGDGTFHAGATYPTTGQFPISVVVGDFNGDGIPDVANSNSGSIDIHLGQQVASFVVNGVGVPGHGDVTVFAAYAGDSLRTASQSPPVTLTTTLASTSVVLTSAPNPARFGLPVTLTAIVTGVNGIDLTGNVVFKESSNIIGTANISGGTATMITTTLAVGVHSIVASYQGDANYTGSTSKAYMQTISQGQAAAMTIASSINPSVFGATVVFTAKLNPGATGTVTFSDGSTVLGVANITSSGTASLSVNTLWAGSHNITATYSGDANYF
jgi:hypothetical protein